MANKRITEMAPLSATDLSGNDLIAVADVSAHETKQLLISELNSYLLKGGNTSGSLYGTSSWATYAIYALNAPTPISVSYASASKWSISSTSSIVALSASFASASISSSYAVTASYVATCSVVLTYSSAFANSANTASFLWYVPGGNTGTASYALIAGQTNGSSSYALTSSNAATASVLKTFNGTWPTSLSASWASKSLSSDTSTTSIFTNYLNYTPGISNGTASYALTAGSTIPVRVNYGIYSSTVNTTTTASIDSIYINPVSKTETATDVIATGNVIIPITAGTTNGTLELNAFDKWSGINYQIDVAPMTQSSTANETLRLPYTLMGEVPLTGSMLLYVKASGGITLDTARSTKFNVSSLSDNVSYYPGEAMYFQVNPSATLFQFTSSMFGGVQIGNAATAISNGADKVTEILITGSGYIIGTKYAWTLNNLTKFRCSNTSITDIGGMPTSITELYCNNCVISKLPSFVSTSLARLDCSYNQLTSLPTMPTTITHITCNANRLTTLPVLPFGMLTLLAAGNVITTLPTSFPNTMVSMSVASNYNLSSWTTALPGALQYLNCNSCRSLTQLPTLPSGLTYLDVSFCLMSSIAMDNICSTLVSNGLSNGYLNLQGNSSYLSSTLTNIAILQGRGWTVVS